MDSIYYVLIILGISFGLIVLYIILRSMKVIGAIPILSDIVDPILNIPSVMMAQASRLMRSEDDVEEDWEDLANEYNIDGTLGDETYENKFPVRKNAVVRSQIVRDFYSDPKEAFGEIIYVEANSHNVDLWRSVRNHMQAHADFGNPEIDGIAVDFGEQVIGAVGSKPKTVRIAILDFGDGGGDLNNPYWKKHANKVKKEGYAPVTWDEDGEELIIEKQAIKMIKNQK